MHHEPKGCPARRLHPHRDVLAHHQRSHRELLAQPVYLPWPLHWQRFIGHQDVVQMPVIVREPRVLLLDHQHGVQVLEIQRRIVLLGQ